MQIQQRHGLFPRILGKGDNARKLANLLLRGRKELDADEAATQYTSLPSTSIEQLILLDRDIDFATVLLTQLTYEGLIDEIVGIKHNRAEVDSSVIGPTPQQKPQIGSSSASAPATATKQGLKRRIQLDSSDTLYEQLRSSNFALIGPHLNKIARRLESDYEGRHNARGINELRDFVNKLPTFQQEHQSLAVHTNLADDMIKQTRSETFNRELEVQQNIVAGSDPIYQHDTIEELIARDVPLSAILRLLCLESAVSGGLRPKDLDSFRRQILHAYGFQHVLTLDKLEAMGLLLPRSSASALLPMGGAGGQPEKGTKTNYASLRKELRLIMDEYNEQEPGDIAYVYSGYAPLSVRVVQCVLQKQYLQSLHKSPLPLTPSSTGWTGFEEILKAVKGPTFNIVQKPADEKAAKAKAALAGTGGWKTIFIMFVGGVTFTEIAALRFVRRKLEEAGLKKRICICATSIVSGRSVMEEVVERSNLGSGITATT